MNAIRTCSTSAVFTYCLFGLLFALGISRELPAQSRSEIACQKSAEALKNAEFIFEGYAKEVANTYCRGYYEYDSSTLFIVYELTLVHCYKGNLQKGTVKVIRPVVYDQHRVGFELNTPYIFLCNQSNFDITCEKDITTNNRQNLQLINEGHIGRFYPGLGLNKYKVDSITYEIGGLYNLNFRTKAEFYAFLLESSDHITLPPQEKNKIDTQFSPKYEAPDPPPDTRYLWKG